MTPAPASDVRTRVLDAAEQSFDRFGLAKTTIDDIATVAGVSRATVYRAFAGGRDEIIHEVVLREAGRFLDRIHQNVAVDRGLPAALIEGVLFTLREVRENEHLAQLLAPEASGHIVAVTGASEALFDLIREFVEPLVDGARATGEIRPGLEVDEISDFLVRIVVSLLTVPPRAERSDADVRRFLERFVLPALIPDHARASP